MRGFTRSETPECLVRRGRVWTDRWLPRLRAGQNLRWPQYNREQSDDILARHLRTDTQEHCSYCDHIIKYDTPEEQIDHFQPKSDYPESAFEWTNLFLCCPTCNTEKGFQFSENLIRMDDANYSFSRFFIYNIESGVIEVRNDLSEVDKLKAETTLKILGLNEGGRPTSRWRTLKSCFRGFDAGDTHIDELSYRFIFEP